MKTTTKKLSDTKVEITVTLDASDLETAKAAALTRMAENIKIQGFRKGKAPVSLVEKQVSPNDLATETLDIAVRTTLPHAFDEAKNPPIAIEKVNVTKYVPGEGAEYTAAADVLPDVKLGDYKKLKAKMPKTEPTAKEVQEIVDNIINAYAEKKTAKKAAENGDEVIIDFTGKKDGEAFPGGTAKDYHLMLGSGQFIPGFEDGIVGHSAGDKFDLELTFPSDYPEKSLAGEKTTFEVLLKQVNEVVKPKADDELAKKCGNFKTMAELKADIKKNLETQNRQQAIERYRDDLVKDLVAKSKVAAPEILIQDQLRFIREDTVRNAASHGLNFDQYLERSGQSSEDWEKTARSLAEDRVKASLVLQILAREQKITASDAEVDAKIGELKDVYQRSKEALASLKKPEVRQDIRNRLVIDKTLDFLVDANDGASIAKDKAASSKAKAKDSESTAKSSSSTAKASGSKTKSSGSKTKTSDN